MNKQSRRTTGAAVAALVLGSALWTPGVATADQGVVDGDGGDTSNSKNSKFELCAGVGSSVDVFATIDYQGSEHFINDGTVTVTAAVPQGAAEFLTALGGSVVTSNWNANNDSVTTAAMPLTVDTDWVAGTYQVDYTFSGRNQNNVAYSFSKTNNVVIAAAEDCDDTGGEDPPPNNAPSVDVTGFVDGASYEIGTAITPTCSVVDAEDSDEGATPQVNGPTGTLAPYGLGLVTVTCSYTDGGGLSATDVESYTVVDTGAPTITDLGPTGGPDGTNNWYISPVTNMFRASDIGAGFTSATPPFLSYQFSGSTGTAEGAELRVASGPVTDVAGNSTASINSASFAVDLSNPLLNITAPADDAILELCTTGAPARPSFAPSDAISGLDGTEDDSWVAPTTGTGVGQYTYTAFATDEAGRNTTDTRTYSTVYGAAFNGVTQPINGGSTADLSDDNSRFKLGSTVPVKFKLVCDGVPVSNAVAKLNVKKADGTPDPGTDEAVSTAASTTGNLFRYDTLAGQYIFNLSTKNSFTNVNGTAVTFTAGTYTLSILLDDGSHRSVNIQLVR